MRQLDCDFCGASASGAYEVLPAELNPSPEAQRGRSGAEASERERWNREQRRVVLCDGCRDTLDEVLAPLLDRLGVDGGTEGARPPSTRSAFAAEGEEEADARAAASGDDSSADPDDAVVVDPGEVVEGDGIDGERTDGESAGDDSTDRDAAGDDPTPDDGPGGASSDDPAGGADGGGDVPERPGEPENFRTVMRLLGNREFPVDRAAVTDLASNAYELPVSEVEAVLDYAVERGVLEEEGGTLRKG